jgi:hypothetical protein
MTTTYEIVRMSGREFHVRLFADGERKDFLREDSFLDPKKRVLLDARLATYADREGFEGPLLDELKERGLIPFEGLPKPVLVWKRVRAGSYIDSTENLVIRKSPRYANAKPRWFLRRVRRDRVVSAWGRFFGTYLEAKYEALRLVEGRFRLRC